MNRTTLNLIGAVTALAAVAGVAAASAPGEDSPGGTAERRPVERSTLVCPKPTLSDVAETDYTAFSPKGGPRSKGSAELHPAALAETGEDPENDGKSGDGENGEGADKDDKGGRGGKSEPFVPLSSPGTPVTDSTDSAEAPALVGSAEGRFAPGWTVQQTTEVSAGAGRGLQGAACTAPDTSMWFPGASTADDRQDYVHLTNPDSTAAVVDLELYGKDGRVSSASGEGVTVPPRSTVPVLLSTLTPDPVTNLTVHVAARSGRVGAQVQAVDERIGGDWLAPVSRATPSVVLPGIPADATSVRLVAFAPGDEDADLSVRLATPSGSIAPAGHDTLHVKGGRTTAVDLRKLTQGQPGSLLLGPAEGSELKTPVVAAARITRGKGARQETAFITSTGPLGQRGTVADNRAKGTTLALAAPGKAAKVRVTASAGSGGGTAVRRTVNVKGGGTTALTPPRPRGGKGSYALTVERVSGGQVHASRMLERSGGGGLPMFTVQTLSDDRGTVAVPDSGQDLSVLTDAD
ncbi:hypothetical protein E0L36_00665 [Streptomyces sp. AJS327]|uniref:DUF5719 family protein n=1 Tax=Streptomyces sp. AJS327 TaxID=2545265 RepID=UPI0015E04FF5|nr:DUF5719 family protein [Streptomyces sp. AJS327]MBA0049477.1 hypothetical protein [Streptomyces sp. AJS327]